MAGDVQEQMAESLKSLTLGQIVTAVVILVVGIILVKLLLKLIKRLLDKSRLDDKIRKIAIVVIRIILYTVVIVMAVSALGINTNSIVVFISVFSLGITLALENVLGNLAGGILLISTTPFKIGDYISVDGNEGTVHQILLNHTELVTTDDITIIIPNQRMSTSTVINYSAQGRRRLIFNVGCSYGSQTEDVQRACRNACDRLPGILKDPKPEIYISNFKDSNIDYVIYVWVMCKDVIPVKKEFYTILREELKKQNCHLAFPQLDVHQV